MKVLNKEDFRICIVGLGYVGLPLASRFSLKGYDLIGFDIKEERVDQLVNKIDINNDISDKNLEVLLKNSKLTSNIDEINGRNVFIITVPTPINNDKTPDLKPLIAASELVGGLLKNDSLVIYESTVYPGVTDEVCTPILEKNSNLKHNQGFSTGYSPERIVPGDKINTIEKIIKIVSASNGDALEVVSFLYSSIIDAGIHMAPSIKVAEAAKLSENIQRDVNIALINEMHQLFTSLGINTQAVIDAASTKWNFMKLTPGLVGGHCISIDPYYLMHKSEMLGYTPHIMSSARKINDEMGNWVKDNFLNFCNNNDIDPFSIKITFLGYTFKENCSDIRNTKVKDLILSIKKIGIKVCLWDPMVREEDLKDLLKEGVEVLSKRPEIVEFAFLCVAHNEIKMFLDNYKGPIYDYRNFTLN